MSKSIKNFDKSVIFALKIFWNLSEAKKNYY